MNSLNRTHLAASAPRVRRGRQRTLCWIVISLMALLGILTGWWYGHDLMQDADRLRKGMVRTRRAVDARQWPRVLNDFAALGPPLQRAVDILEWTDVLERTPYLGPYVSTALHLLETAAHGALAAGDFRPLLLQRGAAREVWSTATWSLAGREDLLNGLRQVGDAAQSDASVLPGALRQYPWDLFGIAGIQEKLSGWDPLSALLSRKNILDSVLMGGRTVRYLVLFQDSGELRSTGGFLAAYGYLSINREGVHLTFGQEIANLANRVTVHPPAPWVLARYFEAQKLSLINANLDPDVPQSARLIERLYSSVPHHVPVSGIIFVDSWLADRALRVLGPVRVGSERYTAHTLNYAMEYESERENLPAPDRMLFLGRIIQVLQRRLARQGPSALMRLGGLIQWGLVHQHLLIYANNPEEERWLMAQHWGGAIPAYRHQNSLLVVDDNLGGLKDNYYLLQHVSVALAGGTAQHRMEIIKIQWTMTGVGDGWLIGGYPGWIRCYVPWGTKLLWMKGYGPAGIKTYPDPSLHRDVEAASIFIPARLRESAPDVHHVLQIAVALPDLSNPDVLHLEFQPGLKSQQVSYLGPQGRLVSFVQSTGVTLHLDGGP